MKINFASSARGLALVSSALALSMANAGGGQGPIDQPVPAKDACAKQGSQGSQGSQGNKQQDCYDDEQIVQRLFAANAMEIRLSRLVDDRSEDEDVQRYAEMLVEEHQSANQRLRGVLGEDVELSADIEPLDDAEAQAMRQQRQTLQRLQRLDGREFDRAYLMAMVQSHELALKKGQIFLQSAESEELKEFLGNLSETVEKHLQQAQELLSDLGGEDSDVDDRD